MASKLEYNLIHMENTFSVSLCLKLNTFIYTVNFSRLDQVRIFKTMQKWFFFKTVLYVVMVPSSQGSLLLRNAFIRTQTCENASYEENNCISQKVYFVKNIWLVYVTKVFSVDLWDLWKGMIKWVYSKELNWKLLTDEQNNVTPICSLKTS